MTKRSYVKGGGTRQTVAGYIAVWRPSHPLAMADGYVLEHRMVAWDTGAMTDPSCVIHHRNGDKADNRPENLEVMSSLSEHTAHHVRDGQLISNQYGQAVAGQGIVRALRARRAAMPARACEICGLDISTLRIDATVCGNNCRVRRWKIAHRRRGA